MKKSIILLVIIFNLFLIGCEFQDEFDPKTPRESTARKWTDGIVYYKFDENYYFTDNQKIFIKNCMQKYENISSLQFIEINSTKGIKYFCTIKIGEENSCSKIGMHKNIILKLTGKNYPHDNVVYHELGHLIGLNHEHQREDRNQYIKIYWKNIIKNKQYNFSIIKNGLIPINKFNYDTKSIMHYSPWTFSKNEKQTLNFKNKNIYSFTTVFFTKTDIEKIKYLYPI